MGALTRISAAIALAVVLALPALGAADDRIEFGSPGAPQTIAFRDAVASASVTFRVSHDLQPFGGPAGASSSILSGSLRVRAFGVSRRYDLATIVPIMTNHIILSKDGDCGTARALSRRGSYLVVEAVLTEKGCAPLAAFIDLRDGRVAKEAIFDPTWDHRFDVHRYRASGPSIRITRVERVVPEGLRFDLSGRSSRIIAWPFLIVHAADARGATPVFAIDLGNQSEHERAVSFRAGDVAFLNPSGMCNGNVNGQYFRCQLVVRPGSAGEARFDARQTPTPKNLQASIRRDHWFEEAYERARRGDIGGAVDALATMVAFHGGGDDIDASDRARLATCRDLVRRVRAGTVSASIASAAFPSGCVLRPARVRPQDRS